MVQAALFGFLVPQTGSYSEAGGLDGVRLGF